MVSLCAFHFTLFSGWNSFSQEPEYIQLNRFKITFPVKSPHKNMDPDTGGNKGKDPFP